MQRKPFFILLTTVFLVSLGAYLYTIPRHTGLLLVGVTDAHEVIVSPKIAGRIERLTVDEGSRVAAGELIAQLDRAERAAQLASATARVASLQARLQEVETSRQWTEDNTAAALAQAEAALAASQAELEEARAELQRARLDFERAAGLYRDGVIAAQARDRAEADFKAARARVASLSDRVKANEAALNLAHADRQQVTLRQNEWVTIRAQLDEARAQKAEAETRLDYTELRAPISGVVSVRVRRQGEIVERGQPIVTLIDIDHLWVRADLPETYVHRVRLGDRFPIRFPDGSQVQGEVFFKGVESDFATQRDVSRTKRDIKTFALKLAIPNPDRRLYVGMTAEVLLPFED
ncbi:MAG: HlyD family secretion protein [Terriglobia bacterium]